MKRFDSGLFALDWDTNDPSRTASWLTFELDLLLQPTIQFTYVCAEGFGSDTYGWRNNLYVRANRLNEQVELIVDLAREAEGEVTVEATVPIDPDDWDALRDNDDESEQAARLLLRAARPMFECRPLTDRDIRAVAELRMIEGESPALVADSRGTWDPVLDR